MGETCYLETAVIYNGIYHFKFTKEKKMNTSLKQFMWEIVHKFLF